jgi:hypothetical protein
MLIHLPQGHQWSATLGPLGPRLHGKAPEAPAKETIYQCTRCGDRLVVDIIAEDLWVISIERSGVASLEGKCPQVN